MLKYLEMRDEWDENELLKKWGVDTREHLEFIMFACGYTKAKGKYKKTENNSNIDDL